MTAFLKFTFEGISMEMNGTGEYKKKPVGMPAWRQITADNASKYVASNHKGHAIITGKPSGITVIDFDDEDVYKKMAEMCPELSQYYKVKTNKGFHVYCTYDPDIKTTTNACVAPFTNVDIRNDNAIVFAPPTFYMLPNGKRVYYIKQEGEILPVPDKMRQTFKQFQIQTAPPESVTVGPERNISLQTTQTQESNNSKNNFQKMLLMKDLFCPVRLNDYNEYIKFTIAMKKNFGEAGKELWDEICSRSSKFDRSKNNEQWSEITLKSLTKEKEISFGSLCWWARQDSPAEYQKLFGARTDWNLSEAAYAAKFKEVCFDGNHILFTGKDKKSEGYLFNGVYWQQLSLHNAELKKGKFTQLYTHYMGQLDKEKDEMSPEKYKALQKELNHLNSHKTRDNVVKIFRDENYVAHVDWNPPHTNRYFVFEDGLMDMTSMEFKKTGNPNDYINLSSGKKWDNGITSSQLLEMRDEMLEFLRGFLSDEDFHHCMKSIATFLEPYNKQQKAYFWLGKGGNGKGTLATILRYALGDYFKPLDMSYYCTSSTDTDRPMQELFESRNGRVLFSSECERREDTGTVTFNHKRFCNLTGQDLCYARELGSSNNDHFIAGKSLLLLNQMCLFTVVDDAIRRRTEVWNFPYRYTNKVTGPNDRLANPDVVSKFQTPAYGSALLSILFDYYQLYLKEGLVPPPSVQAHTDKYFLETSIRPFIEENYEKAPGSTIDLRNMQVKYEEMYSKKLSVEKLKKKLEEVGYQVTKSSGYFKLRDWQQPSLHNEFEE